MSKSPHEKLDELSELLLAILDTDGMSEQEIKAEFAAERQNYALQRASVESFIAELEAEQARLHLAHLEQADDTAVRSAYGRMRDTVRAMGLKTVELVERLVRLQPAIANRDFAGWTNHDLENELADALVLKERGKKSTFVRPNIDGALEAAERVLAQFSIATPEDIRVEGIAKALGVDIVTGHLDGAVARLAVVGDAARIVVDERSDPARRRFSIAHELGHFVLHRSAMCVCSAADLFNYSARSPREKEANQFAAELTMPERLIAERCRTSEVSLEAIESIARDFGTSLTASAIQYTRNTDYSCALVMCSASGIEWTYANPYFTASIASVIHPRSGAGKWFSHRVRNDRVKTLVDPSVWLSEPQSSYAELYEWTVTMPALGRALVVLWLAFS